MNRFKKIMDIAGVIFTIVLMTAVVAAICAAFFLAIVEEMEKRDVVRHSLLGTSYTIEDGFMGFDDRDWL